MNYSVQYAKDFKKQYQKLPLKIQKKFIKQFKLLLADFRHPSLRSKKMGGSEVYEARVDYHYRFVYQIIENEIWFVSVGPYDEGLGKK